MHASTTASTSPRTIHRSWMKDVTPKSHPGRNVTKRKGKAAWEYIYRPTVNIPNKKIPRFSSVTLRVHPGRSVVDRPAFNRMVAGSIPVSGAKPFFLSSLCPSPRVRVRVRVVCLAGCLGSIPVSGAKPFFAPAGWDQKATLIHSLGVGRVLLMVHSAVSDVVACSYCKVVPLMLSFAASWTFTEGCLYHGRGSCHASPAGSCSGRMSRTQGKGSGGSSHRRGYLRAPAGEWRP